MNVEAKLEQVFREVLEDDELTLTDEMSAHDVEAWDSLAHINLMFAVEEEFGLEFSDEQFTSFQSVGELRRFIRDSLGIS